MFIKDLYSKTEIIVCCTIQTIAAIRNNSPKLANRCLDTIINEATQLKEFLKEKE